MGNYRSRRIPKEPKKVFENERLKHLEPEHALAQGKADLRGLPANPGAAPQPILTPVRPALAQYDNEAIARMREQLKHDANAFLLNNIMLSVQFVDNYDKIMYDLTNNSVTPGDVELNEQMAPHHKHVFAPDKLQEAVHAHAQYRPVGTPGTPGALQPQRMFVVHDNVEANAPGEVSDYSTVLDAPYYRLLVEQCDEPGYVKLKKIEILENKAQREESHKKCDYAANSDYSSDSESESVASDDKPGGGGITEGASFMNKLKEHIEKPPKPTFRVPELGELNVDREVDVTTRRPSGILKTTNRQNGGQVKKTTINTDSLTTDIEEPYKPKEDDYSTGRRPSGILKQPNRAVQGGTLNGNGTGRPKRVRQRAAAPSIQETKKISPSGSESSGYKSSHSPQYESSGNESDYGYATITSQTTPRRLQVSSRARPSDSSSVIPLECFSVIRVQKTSSQESDEADDDIDNAYSARYGSDHEVQLYKRVYYLNSTYFMANFADLYVLKLGRPLGFPAESLREALTQGASIYCNVKRGNLTSYYEVIPAVNSTWPIAARGWLTRQRNIIKNPRTDRVYQWPTRRMVGRAQGLGCLLVPLGFRPSRAVAPPTAERLQLQWRICFPAVERYLETCLAHSQVRCYLFSLLLFKTHIKNPQAEIGLDHSHIRNHLFWQCEDNYAKWPEDRLGETLRLFFNSFYQNIMRGKMPDYFISNCNLLKGIPKTVLYKQQRKLADIMESPVYHLLSALKNLKYMKPNFYPVFNYRKLYKILVCEDVLRLMNPQLPRAEEERPDEDSDEDEPRENSFWSDIKRKNPNYDWRIQQLRQREAKKAAETLVNQKGPKETSSKRILPSYLESNRRRLVLEMFIPHFLSMAECSERFENVRQAVIYLEHARRLNILLSDDPASRMQADEYASTIADKLEVMRGKAAKSVAAPKVPRRNDNGERLNGISNFGSTEKISTSWRDRPSTSTGFGSKEKLNTSTTFGSKEKVSSNSSLNSIDKPSTSNGFGSSEKVNVEVHVPSEKTERPPVFRGISFQKVDEESGEESDVTESKL